MYFKLFNFQKYFWVFCKNKSPYSNRFLSFNRLNFYFFSSFFFSFFLKYLVLFMLSLFRQKTRIGFQKRLYSLPDLYIQSVNFHYKTTTFLQNKNWTALFITTLPMLCHFVYQYAKSLNQPCFTQRWLSGTFSNRLILSNSLINQGLLDFRLIKQQPTLIFLIGGDHKVISEVSKEPCLFIGFLGIEYPLNIFDIVYPINEKSFFGVFFFLNFLKKYLLRLFLVT